MIQPIAGLPELFGRGPFPYSVVDALQLPAADAGFAAGHYVLRPVSHCSVLKRMLRVEPSHSGAPHCGPHCHARTAAHTTTADRTATSRACLTRHILSQEFNTGFLLSEQKA